MFRATGFAANVYRAPDSTVKYCKGPKQPNDGAPGSTEKILGLLGSGHPPIGTLKCSRTQQTLLAIERQLWNAINDQKINI